MIPIDEVISPVEEHLKEFNTYFKNMLKSDVSLLNLILQYITKKRGKQLRPTIVFLVADLCGGVNKRTFSGAAMVELLHTATLVHDDVVDESFERRGIPTINAIWRNKVAVLIGDYLLGKGLLTAIDDSEFDFLRATSLAVLRMSEGELLQIKKSKEINSDEKIYFRIIADKTASLMAACCEIGAISATANVETQLLMRQFGEYLGIAFQIQDDLFDYLSHGNTIGKPVGNDLKERKITLPLIYAFSKVQKSQSREIIKLVKSGKLAKKDIRKIVDFASENGGIDYAKNKAIEFSDKAAELLTTFNPSASKESLLYLTKFVIERKL